ncbi:hypothetical protein [Amycolatopsis sp. WQ 127309]|uniref:hypothetical protein n=1 Tax=Amycolatopsis sp. WQ 127309 TaxID=2932773 RepID=UPI001FF27223|nr:hypothetical protein [Amycolatopsis sp. WQ 127309]UOZ09540.1 hypothetical protein MUY22_15210 [Amycolatopsis sp. WQ 127309]
MTLERLAAQPHRSDVVAVVPTPTAPADLPLRPMAQAWHPRFAKDPGHRWLRARVRDAAPTG